MNDAGGPGHPKALLQAALDQGVGTGAQLVASVDGVIVHDVALGVTAPDGPPVTHTTRFDVASVTKVAATTTLAAMLVARGALRLDDPVARWLPGVACAGVTLRALLGHRSGLPAWRPLFNASRRHPACAGLWPDDRTGGGTDRALSRRRVLDAACAEVPAAPVRAYSDVGFLALGSVLEAAAGAPLDVLFQQQVAEPLGLRAGYRRLSASPPGEAIPVTGVLRPREPAPGQEDAYVTGPQRPQLRPGEVDDDNAWAADGVAGHAGLFASASDLRAIGQAWLEDADGAGRLVSGEVARAFLARDAPDLGPVRSLGWDRVAAEGSSAGTRLGRGPSGGVGHLGFTGASLWIDLDARVVVALVTNRTFPSRTARAPIRALRPALHDAVMATIAP